MCAPWHIPLGLFELFCTFISAGHSSRLYMKVAVKALQYSASKLGGIHFKLRSIHFSNAALFTLLELKSNGYKYVVKVS